MCGDMGRYGPPLAARRRPDAVLVPPHLSEGCEGSGKVPRDAPMQSWYRPTSSVSAAKQRTVRIMPTRVERWSRSGEIASSSGRCASCLRDASHTSRVPNPSVLCERHSREILRLRAERLSRRDRRAGERSLVLLGEAGHEPGMSRKCLGSVSEASRKGDVGRCGEMWGDVGRW